MLETLPAETLTISLPFWARQVDDYLMVLQGPEENRHCILNAFRTADPDRPLTVHTSTQSVDFLDVTVYKGHRFYTTGVLDTKPYTKPSYTGMHLHYSSHHPTSTFTSILSGHHNRSAVTSSDISAHRQCMNSKVRSFFIQRVSHQPPYQMATAGHHQLKKAIPTREEKAPNQGKEMCADC